ncbi:hypothetical protein CNMCM8927_001631 [Aspergillus lentulus]|uniref:Uncharacterized protein n=1 Tax=Aspergillus lentulus TaxID=293939 RepID=A0AAN5YHT0_ASPLE|nr:hypothetical protein CNMCM6069_007418 [Aspergillus lentulus]KAF4201397.1 hypothetical protein CNMCM8927_001631 [Aspergillus lentulus]GFF90357.1 hypothetical protein IFM60648_09037 [Aspergillus lentulus]GFF90527.1 hypothetical protein IFM47457_08518 [Aspergillus lentulus]
MSSPAEHSSGESSHGHNWPNPALRHPRFILAEMPDPPPSWKFLGESADVVLRTRKYVREQMVAMLDFYSWGIDTGMPSRLTNLRILQALWKIFYYTADYHRPRSFRDLLDFEGKDGGPRLLSCEIDHPSLLPISRYYPDPPALDGTTQPDFVRPANAAANIPDIYLERMNKPSRDLDMSETEALGSSPPAMGTLNLGGNGNTAAFQNNNLTTAVVSAAAGPLANPTLTAPANPTGVFIPAPAPSAVVRVPAHMARAIIEDVEKVVMKYAYLELERDASAAPQTVARPYLTALDERDISKAIVGLYHANAQVRLSLDPHDPTRTIIDPTGNDYPCRGRGPIWKNNSSTIDSLIVVGKLLDAGSTVIDRKRAGWETRFGALERAFIEATDVNWDVLSLDENSEMRDHFWEVVQEHVAGVQPGLLSPLWTVWSDCAGHFDQFHFTYREAVAPCQCTGQTATVQAHTKTFVAPDLHPGDMHGVSMTEVMARPFAPLLHADCTTCNAPQSVTIERRFDTLPLRMVVGLDEQVSVKNHTKDITFDFCDGDGQLQKATYRWLGGIYYKDYRYRVFWTDTKRGETDHGFLKMYDSTMNAGLIIGDIPPAHRDERVPPEWWRNTSVPFLVYERVMDPEPEVFSLAYHSLLDMMKVKMEGKLVAQEHTPWTRAEPALPTQSPPWDRILPNADRFKLAADGVTEEQEQSITVRSQTSVSSAGHSSGRSSGPDLPSAPTSVRSSMRVSPVPTGMKQAAYTQAPTTYTSAIPATVGPFVSTFATAQPVGVNPFEINPPMNTTSLFSGFNRRSNSPQNPFSNFANFTNTLVMQPTGDPSAMSISPTQQFFWIPSASNSPEKHRTGQTGQPSPEMMAGFAVCGALQPIYMRVSPKRAVEEVHDNSDNNNRSESTNVNGTDNGDGDNGATADTTMEPPPRKRARTQAERTERVGTRRSTRLSR